LKAGKQLLSKRLPHNLNLFEFDILSPTGLKSFGSCIFPAGAKILPGDLGDFSEASGSLFQDYFSVVVTETTQQWYNGIFAIPS
jgi:hypothetical protein